MLTRLVLHDFKSFHRAELELSRLTLLVGANASGKSNVFDAIRFLQGIALGMSVGDVLHGRWEGGRELWPGIRGGIEEVARYGAESFGLESSWRTATAVYRHQLNWHSYAEPSLIEWFSREEPEPRLISENETSDSGSSLFGRLEHDPEMFDVASTKAIAELRDTIRGAFFLDINPRRMRDYVPKGNTQLGSEGQNVSAAVWRLCKSEDRKRDLLDWMSELCAPALADIEFEMTGLGDVMLVLVEKDGARVSARSLSDGTLRFLGELTALLTAPRGSLILVEEIENGLHPARIHLLVELLTGLTAEREVQILATTHSPAVLGALAEADPALARAALVFGRIPEEPGTVARRLGDLPHFDEVVQRRGIEHLFTTQWLERAL